jgi:hypothetical protein
MIVTAYLGSQYTAFTQLDGCAAFSRHCIYSRISGLMRFLNGSDKGTASDFVQISEDVRR